VRDAARSKPWRGLDAPNFTPFPNQLLDELLCTLTPPQWKVVCFLARKTFGWAKRADRISVRQMVAGTGLSRRAVIAAVQALEAAGVVHVERGLDDDGRTETNLYAFTFAPQREGAFCAPPYVRPD